MNRKIPTKVSVILTLLLIVFGAWMLFMAEGNLNTYMVRIIAIIGVYGIMAVSLNLINGITGIFSLGHSGFMAIGAYVSALLTLSVEQKQMTFILEPIIFPFDQAFFSSQPFLLSTMMGGIVAAIFAFLIGWPTLRLAGDYLAITTLGFSEIIRIIFLNTNGLTNGALGLKDIPSYTNVWWSWGWLLVTLVIICSLLCSTYGRTLRAIREDRVAAEVMGINVFKHQLTSFVIGGFFAGVAGGLYAHWLSAIDPKVTTIGVMLTFNALIMIVIGGLGSITGSLVGAALFAFFSEFLRFVESDMHIFNLTIPGISGMRMLVFSLLFILVMIFWPKGIFGRKELTWNAVYRLFHGSRQRKSGDYDA